MDTSLGSFWFPGRRAGPNKPPNTAVAKKRPPEYFAPPTVAKKYKPNVDTIKESTDKSKACKKLDEWTNSVLDEELQAIMIKVWQALPDNPPTAAERYVAELLRNTASDDIRNVLGLNVTKRLLNVFNGLYVTVGFSAKPDAPELKEFGRRHNFLELQPHGRKPTYTGRLGCIADFDRLCNAKELRCGNITVTVHPCYRFSELPLGLKTSYVKKLKLASKTKQDQKVTDKKNTVVSSGVKEATANMEPAQQTVKSKQISKSGQTKTIIEKTAVSSQKVAASQETPKNTKQNNIMPNKAQLKPNAVKETQNVQKICSQSDAAQPKVTQVTQKTATVTNTPKPNLNQAAQESAKVKNAPTPKPPQVPKETSVVKNSPTPKQNTVTQQIKNINVAVSKPTSTPIPNQAKAQVVTAKQVTEAAQKSIPNQPKKELVATSPVVKPTPKSVVDKPVVTTKQEAATKNLGTEQKTMQNNNTNVAKPQLNQVNKPPVAISKAIESKPKLKKNVKMAYNAFDGMNDDEEMNDEEILALISTGIVVDECSGSDVERND